MNESQFLFVCCQAGAEQALKDELARNRPELRFAYSRPGFVTFKLPPESAAGDYAELPSVFARTHGFSLGKVQGFDAAKLAEQAWELVASHPAIGKPVRQIHVWQRDERLPGDDGFEPGPTALSEEVGRLLAEKMPRESAAPPPEVNRVSRPGSQVMDCVLVDPQEWWLGVHEASSIPARWPGGACPLDYASPGVSRAYLKMYEALEWSRMPVRARDLCAEIGSSPGGSCLALLDRGLRVLGIDPAEMDEEVLSHPNFTHIRKRGRDVRRRDFSEVRWLMTDINVAPKYTLDTVEEIVTHDSVRVQGMLLTLKLTDWELAEQIPALLDRIRGWGFGYTRARQLAFNRREFCVAALRQRTSRRPKTLQKFKKHRRPTRLDGI
ncbi:MAG: hypothetical protein KDA71_24165 [Planctomycetales bacterium]|nr:hypothetical protein [Planctomycetales bacterium]